MTVAKLRMTCPACRQMLGVEEGVSEPWLTCPHCLTQVMNPWQQVTATPPPAPAHTAAPPGPPRCPVCGSRDVEGRHYCPHCNADLRGGKQTRTAGAALDREVKRDAQGSVFSLGVFLVLAVGGLILFLGLGGVQAFANSPNHAGPPLVMGLVVTLLLAGGFALLAGPRSPEQKVLSGFLGGFTIALVLFVAFVFAACANFTATCGGLLQPKR
jgi:hypothetical protein